MAKIKSGWLHLSKTELNQVKTALLHAKIDLSFGWGGSYGGGDQSPEDDRKEKKEMEKGAKGIETLEWIIKSYCKE